MLALEAVRTVGSPTVTKEHKQLASMINKQ